MKSSKNTRKYSPVRILLIIVVSLVIAVAVYYLAATAYKYILNKKNINEAAQKYVPPQITPEQPIEPVQPLLDPETGVIPRFSELYKTNPDIFGWISIKGTKLYSPVVRGKDNSFYLNHSVKGTYDVFGTPFTHFDTKLSLDDQSGNIPIFAHALKDGTQFGDLKKYKDIEYYRQHPIVDFDTIYGYGSYKIIALFMEDVISTNEDMFNYHDYVNEVDEKHYYDYYIDNVMKRSYYITDVDVEFGDKFISLSTCDYEVDRNNFRIVLVARKIRPGESSEVNVDLAKVNENRMMPARWYEKNKIPNPFPNR